MPRIAKHILKLALVVFLFEISLAPFLAEEVGAAKNCVTYETLDKSLDLPDFFKEQDEKDSERTCSFSRFVPILDLTTHNHRLESAQRFFIDPITYPVNVSRFTLLHTLLI